MKFQYTTKNILNIAGHTAMGVDLATWWYILKKNNFKIQLPFLPKALFITATATVNAPLQWLEGIRFSKQIAKTSVRQPVFIVGHPRSGTTFLQYLLGQDPSFAYCSTYEGIVPHVFLTGGKTLQRVIQAAMPATRPQDNVRISTSLPVEEEFAMANISHASWRHGLYFPESLYQVLDEAILFNSSDSHILENWKKQFLYFTKKLSFKYDEKTLLLKSPVHTGRVKEILEVFPDARFIHIHRNPYEVFQSTERLYEKILPVISFQRADENFIGEYIFHFYEKVYRKYLSDIQQIPSHQLIEFSYDELTADPLSVMKKTYEQLSLGDFEKAKPFLQKELTETKTYERNKYVMLDESVKQRINEQWKFAFDAFGYQTEVKQ